jgi:hypothetical protein
LHSPTKYCQEKGIVTGKEVTADWMLRHSHCPELHWHRQCSKHPAV